MIKWLGQPRTWLAQEAQPTPEEAAGQAAQDRARKSAWPPTEEDIAAIGSAAGSAAGAAIGGPVGAAVGSVIGAAVGSAVFQLGVAIAGGLDPNRNTLREHAEVLARTAAYLEDTIETLVATCSGNKQTEVDALIRWGALHVTDSGLLSGELRGSSMQLKISVQRSIFQASSARLAECSTSQEIARKEQAAASKSSAAPRKEQAAASKSSAAPLVVGAAIIGGFAWWLLA